VNWLDIVIIIALILFVISGIVSGLIKAVFSLAGLILGIFLAGRYYVQLSGIFGFISNDSAAKIVAFIIIFLVVLIIATILGIIFTKIVSNLMLGWLNRLLGGIFGVFEGALFIGAILAVIVKMTGSQDAITGSILAQFFLNRFPVVLSLLPSEFDSIRGFYQ
jgi:membrane protein required for colicin V production